MEEYIMLEEEKARKRDKVFNWETAKYDKIWYDEDVHNVRSVETEFPTIVFNDTLMDNDNDKIDIEKPSGDMSVIPLPNVINVDVGAYAHGSNKLLETSLNTTYPGDLTEKKKSTMLVKVSTSLEVLES
ncbi:hypothetical protein Tco_0765415 [Tanacetum coccineum]